MGFVVFNGLGLLYSLLCCGLAMGCVALGSWFGWIPNKTELPWIAFIWAQSAAIVALIWDRSEKRGFFTPYFTHFMQFTEETFNRQEAKAKYRFAHPGRRVLFCGFPLAVYPLAMLAVAGFLVAIEIGRNPEWTLAQHANYARLLWLFGSANAFTLLFAYVTSKRRLLAPPPKPPSSPAAVRQSEQLFDIVDDAPQE